MMNVVLDMSRPWPRHGSSQTFRVVTVVAVALFSLTVAHPTWAQKWTGHRLVGPNELPGAIGQKQLLGNIHRRRHTQPVRIVVPESARIATAHAGTFGEAASGPITVGLQVGSVYRFEVFDGSGNFIVYPTIEVIDRLYPPRGSELRFPIPIELTAAELRLAAAGSYVTRVIYVEDPTTALPYREDTSGEQNYFEVDPDQDPVEVAFNLGRSVAILRMGSRAPDSQGDNLAFTMGAPEVQFYVTENSSPSTEGHCVEPTSFPAAHRPPRPFPKPVAASPLPLSSE